MCIHMYHPVTKDGRGIYQGFVPSGIKPMQFGGGLQASCSVLEANYYLAKEFYPDLEKDAFQNYWAKEFEYFEQVGLKGQIQLNFPEIPLIDLMEKYRDMTRRLKGTGEDVEGIRNYCPEYFTPERLQATEPQTADWVTLIVENPDADDKNDPTLFGLGFSGNAICSERTRLIDGWRQTAPELDFTYGSARTRVIQSLLFMKTRLSRKEHLPATDKIRIKFWAIQLLMAEQSEDGQIPYVFMDGGGGACLGRDGGAGNSVYGFCVQATRQGNKT